MNFEMLKAFRETDLNDWSWEYNISSKIKEELIDYVVNNEKLLDNPQIKERFEKIQDILKEPDKFVDGLIEAFKDKTENREEVMWKLHIYHTDEAKDYLVKNWIDIKWAVNKIESFLEKTIGMKKQKEVKQDFEEDIRKKLNQENTEFTEEDLQEKVDKAYEIYEERVKEELETMVKILSVEHILSTFGEKELNKIKQDNPKIAMYSDLEWFWIFDLSDEAIDKWRNGLKEFVIQLSIISISWLSWNLFVRLLKARSYF